MSFARDGYAVLPRFLGAAELEALRQHVDAVLAGPLPHGCERPHNTLVPLRFDHAAVALVLASRRRIDALRAAVGARDLRWISGYVSVKEPRTAALWWHQDWWCWDHPVTYRPPAPQVAVLAYLAGTDPVSGALRVLPGSHRRSLDLHAVLPEAHGQHADNGDLSHPAFADHPDQITLAMRAGDAVVVDYRLLHGTHPNAGDRRRDCLLLSFAPHWRALPWDIRGHLIQHPALPHADERLPAWADDLLPSHDGQPADLALERNPPAQFQIA